MTMPPQQAPPPELTGKRVAILGAGKVGGAAGVALAAAGVPIAAVTARSPEHARDAAELMGAALATTDNVAAASVADIVLITVNDDAIGPVCAEVASAGGFAPGQLVAHMSGALRLSVLEPASEAGALVGSAHPLRAFASREQAIRDLPGSVFGVTAQSAAAPAIVALVEAMGGQPVEVDDDVKPLYHAAAVVASNYLVALEDVAAEMLAHTGFDRDDALRALMPLVRTTLDNLGEFGTTNALTGPIVRGDAETVAGHLEAMRDLPAETQELYRALGRRALAIARRRRTLTPEADARLGGLLGE
jgi:predicted short-subunit dehydrogenase-like oxidoreductase (DUF2520 family)